MNLYLTGGGEPEGYARLEKELVANLPRGATIAVLPMACDAEDYREVLLDVKDRFDDNRIGSIELIEDASEITEGELLAYDALFIEGGNTFRLIKEVRGSSLFSHLGAFIAQKKIIYADSAGAIVLGTDVHSAFLGNEADEDHEKLQDYRGLNLVGNWSFHCHYESGDLPHMQDLLYETGSPFLALPEPIGIHILNGEVEVFGRGNLEVLDFSGQRSHPAGKKFSIDLE